MLQIAVSPVALALDPLGKRWVEATNRVRTDAFARSCRRPAVACCSKVDTDLWNFPTSPFITHDAISFIVETFDKGSAGPPVKFPAMTCIAPCQVLM
jgi:hypothetical protein